MENTTSNTNEMINLSYEELDFVLSKVVSKNPNKEDIQTSNETLKKYSKNILSVEGFILQIKNNPNERIRQLSAILLYRKLEKHWLNMDKGACDTMKNIILGLLATEKNYLVLKAIANLVYRIAKLNLINKEWTDLLDYVFSDPNKYSADQAFLFELNLYIISELIESCSFYLKHKLEEIKVILQVALTMGSQRMKENSTKCLGNLVRSLEKEQLPLFKDLIPCIFKEIKNFTEETVLHIYETFCDFHINSLQFFDQYFDDIIPLTLEFLQNLEFNGNSKLVISEFLLMIGECKKKIFTKNDCQFLKQSLEVGFKLACEGDEDQDTSTGELSDYSIGMRMIDSLSQIIQSKYIFPICSGYIQKLMTSSDSNHRRAGIVALGAIAEGCCEKIKEILDQVVDTLVNSFMNDPDSKVKAAVILTMDQLTINCAPDINEYHPKVIPMLMQGIMCKEDEIIEKSLIELNYFCRNLDMELDDYVKELLPKLIDLLGSHKSVKVQEECLFALASIIGGAQNLIGETLFPILDTCKNIILHRNTEEEVELRANALDCVAHIAFVIKLEKFQPYMQFFTAFATECIKSDKYEFQDAGFMYFGSLAGIMGESISTDLPVLMARAFEILKDDSGLTTNKSKDEFGLDSDSDDDEDGQEEGKIQDVYVSDAFVDAKCSVILAITNFAKAAPTTFINFINEVFIHFENLWNYIHDNVNLELISAYQSLLISINDAEEKIKAFNGANLHEEPLAKKIWTTEIFPKYEKVFEESDLKEEVCKVLEAIYEIINNFGRNLFINNNSLQSIMNMCKLLLENQAVCQIKNDDEEEDPDHDEQILGGVVDIFLITSEKLGNDFHDSFTAAFPSLKKYLNVKRSENDRSMIFGCIADTLKYCKISSKFYFEILMASCEENIQKNMKRKDEDLFRHIAYLIGVLYEACPEFSISYLSNGLKLLQTIMESTKKTAKDNVIAALCRICVALQLNASNCEFFPKFVETILSNAPLKHDTFENPAVFKFIEYSYDKLDMKGYELYLENILLTLKTLILNEIKCGTSQALIKEIKTYLEVLNGNELLKTAIEKFVSSIPDAERERFINTVRNA
jgi:hypothetical protein